MRTVLAFILCLFVACPVVAQTAERVPINAISASANTGQDYSSWLTDNTDSLVPNAWENNFVWVDITLHLQQKTVLSKLTFFDYEGVFTDKPAYIYALNGNERIFLGVFTGSSYKTFIDLAVDFPVIADAIVIHKYSNNIPQKIQVFGVAYDPLTTALPQNRLRFTSVIPTENTGQDYTQWLNDDLDSLVGWGNANSFKYIDVTLKLPQRSKIKRLSFWDTEGEFTSNPAFFYAIKDTQKIFIGSFVGTTYNTWVDLNLPEAVTADAILVHKFSRYIPQKIFAYGQALPVDPLDTIVPPDGRLQIANIEADPATGMDFSSYFSDDTDSLVSGSWNHENFAYTDVKLRLVKPAKIGRIALYDFEGTFTEHPAFIYAQNDTGKILLAKFEGLTYKTFVPVDLPDSIDANAIIVHKYGNDIPQKVKLYGTYLPTKNVGGEIDTATIVKIPVNGKNWFQLNNVANGLEGLFDGKTDERVETGWGKILSNYDAWYPLEKDEEISITDVKFFDGEGSLGPYPMTLSVVTADGNRVTLASFTGSRYNEWVGPHPDAETNGAAKFKVDTIVKNARYLVLNCWYGYPNEIELYGNYKASVIVKAPLVKPRFKLKNTFGVNAFEWDFESPYDPFKIDERRFNAIKQFSGVRHYMDWEKLESQEGSYTYSPVHSGGWNYDTIYERCKAQGIEVLACLKTMPGWMQQTYPNDQRDAENVPLRFGKDFSDPMSYIEQARTAFQYIARYGNNTQVDRSLLHVNGAQRWTNDDVNTIKVGLSVIKYIECDNERDKWWKGRKGYQTAFEYAANLSAFYDGNQNTMGVGVGVKNADPQVQVVMGGLADPSPDYLRGMIEWCRLHRGYKADGSVNLCWDVINYHLYSNDASTSQGGNATRGAAPELSGATEKAIAFLQVAHEYANDMPVWITELGYDLNQGSPLRAMPVGNKSEYLTQADWLLRSALLYARSGVQKVFFYQLYDDNFYNPIQFGSMGLLNPDKSRRPAADYLLQVNNLLGEFSYEKTIETYPLVDKYEQNGNAAYALMMPTESGKQTVYNLDLAGFDSARIYLPVAVTDQMNMEVVAVLNGNLSVPVTETPQFVKPFHPSSASAVINSKDALLAVPVLLSSIEKIPSINAGASSVSIFPNPTSSEVNIRFETKVNSLVEINVFEAASGRQISSLAAIKNHPVFTRRLNVNHLAPGVYLFEVKQGTEKFVIKLIKKEQ